MENTISLKEKLLLIPEQPGIYQMLDSKGKIIYIGKSKCLKKRVRSYFTASPKWEKVTRMISQIYGIEYITTDTHLEARLLECELIKHYRPKYNAQMNHDSSYVYLKVEEYNPTNPLCVIQHREENTFGPFRGAYWLNEFINSLKNLYPFARSNKEYQFEYHIFPEVMDKATFESNKEILLELFTNDDNIHVLNECIKNKMEEAASQYRFESAGIYRDLIMNFERLRHGLNGYRSLAARDILLKIPLSDGYKLFYISGSQIIISEVVQNLYEQLIYNFIERAKQAKETIILPMREEKSNIDFRDILYSEIMSMPDDMVQIL